MCIPCLSPSCLVYVCSYFHQTQAFAEFWSSLTIFQFINQVPLKVLFVCLTPKVFLNSTEHFLLSTNSFFSTAKTIGRPFKKASTVNVLVDVFSQHFKSYTRISLDLNPVQLHRKSHEHSYFGPVLNKTFHKVCVNHFMYFPRFFDYKKLSHTVLPVKYRSSENI